MKHEVLAGAPSHGLGLNLNDLKKFKLSDLKNIIGSLKCIGGTAYDASDLDKNINILTDYFNGLVTAINQAVQQNNMPELRNRVTEFKGTAKLIRLCFYEKRYKDKNWNTCTDANLDASIKIAEFFEKTCGQALDAWLTNNFNNIGYSGSQVFQSTPQSNIETTMGLDFTYTGASVSHTQLMYAYEPKPKNIPAFEITPYITQVGNGSFNTSQFLQSLTQTVANFATPNTNNTGGSNTGSNVIDYNNPNTVKQNGGGIIGWLIVIAGMGYAASTFAGMPDAGKEAKTQPTNKKITV